MKSWNPTRTLSLWMLVSAVVTGCRTESATNYAASSQAKAEVRIAEPEQPRIERLPAAGAPRVEQLVEAYNARNFGSPGWRRVLMELVTDGAVTRTFAVVNLWRSDNDSVRMLFLLEEPKGLSGTGYLLEEPRREGLPDMQVHLFLPAGERRVLEVAPSNFSEGLLGSDFSYQDVRTQLPVKGYRYSVKGQSTLLDTPVWVLEAEPATEETREVCAWSTADLYLSRDFPFLLGADFYGKSDRGATAPPMLKQMRVRSLKQIDGVWTATRIAMYSRNGRSSILTLKDAGFNSKQVDADLFSAKELPTLSEKVRQGLSVLRP